MKYKSWLEKTRLELESYTPEEIAEEREKALALEAEWRQAGKFKTNEDEIMSVYACNRLEKEMLALGDYIMQHLTDPDDAWWLAESVYDYYGYYYMLVRKHDLAEKWFLKSFENNKPHPYSSYLCLAGVYAEMGDDDWADHWIDLYLAYYRSEDNQLSSDAVINIANYYCDTNRFDIANSLLLEIKDVQKYHGEEYLPLLAKTFYQLGKYEECFAAFDQQISMYTRDAQTMAEIALAHYSIYQDAAYAEAYYLKSLEIAPIIWDNHNLWDASIYRNLSMVFANEGNWDKCYYYIKERFKCQYPPNEAAVLVDMMEHLPEIDSDEAGAELLRVILAFEESMLRPTKDRITEDKQSDNPTHEVKDAIEGNSDLSSLMDLGDASAN